MSDRTDTAASIESARAHDTVEAVVRAQLGKALGGVRGMVEAAEPTLGFTVTYMVGNWQAVLAALLTIAAVVLLVVNIRELRRG